MSRNPRTNRHRLTAIASAAALVLTLAACTNGEAEESEASSDTSVLRVGIYQEIDSLDPAQTGLAMTSTVLQHIYDPLIWYLPDESGDLTFYPGLAEEWEVSGDATTYTFHLREDVTFHDDTPMTADAVKATFDHITDPDTPSRSAIASLSTLQEVRVVDDYTVEIVFSEPNSSFLRQVSSPVFGIQSPTALEELGTDIATHPTGTGPYEFKSYTAQDSVVVTRNEDYAWGPETLGMEGPATFEEIDFEILLETNARFNALQGGQIDVAMNLDAETITAVQSNDEFKHYDVPATGIPYGYPLNVELAPTDDPLVRQAIMHAVDIETLNETVLQGVYSPAFNYVTPTTTGYVEDNDSMYPYDPAEAANLLDEAGWVEGADGMRTKDGEPLTVSFLLQTDNGFEVPTSYIVEALRSVGIATTVESRPFTTAMAEYNEGTYNMSAFFFYSPDPDMLRSTLTTAQIPAGFNWSHYSTPEMDAAVAAANTFADEEERAAAYQGITTTVMEEALYLPLWNVSGIYSARTDLTAISFNATGYALFHAARFE
jgi:peptide/nickel transport system substrate-binding protein